MFTHAVTRRPGPDLGSGLTTVDLGAPDYDLACRQFEAYCAALEACGLAVAVLDALPGYPDAHFVEDTAVLTRNSAVISRPGAGSRRGEEDAMAPVLAAYRPLIRIEAPGTLDGGDVLMVGNHALIGISARTNAEGARQLGQVIEAEGGSWDPIPVGAGLHFKSSVNLVGEDTLLVGADFADHPALARWEKILVPVAETYAACTLWINDHLIVPTGYPRTRELLEPLGRSILEIDSSEFRRMDGGMTCLSLRLGS